MQKGVLQALNNQAKELIHTYQMEKSKIINLKFLQTVMADKAPDTDGLTFAVYFLPPEQTILLFNEEVMAYFTPRM